MKKMALEQKMNCYY